MDIAGDLSPFRTVLKNSVCPLGSQYCCLFPCYEQFNVSTSVFIFSTKQTEKFLAENISLTPRPIWQLFCDLDPNHFDPYPYPTPPIVTLFTIWLCANSCVYFGKCLLLFPTYCIFDQAHTTGDVNNQVGYHSCHLNEFQ